MSTTVALPAGIGRRAGLWTLLSWVLVGVVVWRGIVVLAFNLRIAEAGLGPWGGDFHGGAWLAGDQILRGVSPYLAPSPHVLFHFSRAFVTPPAIGLAAVPLAHLPYPLAVGIWNLVDVAALVAALWVLDVRDLRMYLLAVFAAPFVSSVTSGQVEGVFALLLALAWRQRSSWPGAVAVGALIAAKLYAFPLVVWLIATRRLRSAALAGGSAALFLAASWGLIDFHGLMQYPRLLDAAAQASQRELPSLSAATLALHLSMSHEVATAMTLVFGVGVMALIVIASRGSDEGWFTAAVTVGLLASPILWGHYLVLLFVPLAISRPRTIWPWLLTAVLWPLEGLPMGPMQAGLTLLATAAIAVVTCAVWAGGGASQPARRPPTLRPARAASNPR
jgi:Glycosyltransferase family 87